MDVRQRALFKRKMTLWRKNPKCRRCGCKTILTGQHNRNAPNGATVQHIYHKYHPKRNHDDILADTILYCNKCNDLDNQEVGSKVFEYDLYVQHKKYIARFSVYRFLIYDGFNYIGYVALNEIRLEKTNHQIPFLIDQIIYRLTKLKHKKLI